MSQPVKEVSKKTSLFGPMVLIGVGIMLLLGNLDVLDLNFWQLLFRFWPVFLIGAGLDILLGRRANGGVLIALMMILGLIFGAIWLGYVETTTPFGVVHGESVSQLLNGASRADVTIATSVSQMRLEAGADVNDALLGGTVALHPNEELERSFAIEGGTAQYKLQSSTRSLILPSFGRSNDGSWDLQLNRLTPTNLTVSTGVGSAILDLQQVNLTGLQVDAGVGKVEITLPLAGNFEGEINGGVGGIMVYVPDTMAVRIEASTGIGSINVDNSFVRDGNVYQSATYETAANRINLTVSGGIGAIDVERVVQ